MNYTAGGAHYQNYEEQSLKNPYRVLPPISNTSMVVVQTNAGYTNVQVSPWAGVQVQTDTTECRPCRPTPLPPIGGSGGAEK